MVCSVRLLAQATTSSIVAVSTAAMYSLWENTRPLRAAVEAATVEDVVACAKSLELHTTYFLKGGSQ